MDQRVKELDGIRGIAILLVMCFHTFKRAVYFTANPALIYITGLSSIGWMGVDVFFVLSGFLITSILLETRENPAYFKNFYARRVLRIFPLYYAIIAAAQLYLSIFQPSVGAKMFDTLLYFVLYQQNWLALNGGMPTLYLLITWSLAIEEQYYLFWPLMVYYLKKRTLVIVSVVIVILSILLRILIVALIPDTKQALIVVYYSTFTRLDALIIGALVAIAFHEGGAWKERLTRAAVPVLFACSALIAAVVFTPASFDVYNNPTIRLAGYTVIPLGTAALIVTALTLSESSPLRRILRAPSLLFLGQYSYALYLFHPVVEEIFLDLLWKSPLRGWYIYAGYLVITFGFSILLALLSWNLLEKRMLALKKYFV